MNSARKFGVFCVNKDVGGCGQLPALDTEQQAKKGEHTDLSICLKFSYLKGHRF